MPGETSKLLRKIIRAQKDYDLIKRDSSILVAVSGGVDSVVLLDALIQLRDFFRYSRLAVAHFNHKLRGKESDEDEEFVKRLADRYSLQIFTSSAPVAEIAKEEKKNLELVARELRYRFLRDTKSREGFDLIATAHHLNDLVETTIIWMVRGAGMEGLLGFEPKEGDIVRPLYLASRREIETYARARGLEWREDSTNYSREFFRNRIRMEVIPVLKELNPNLEETFLRMREVMKEEDEFMRLAVSREMRRVVEGESCLKIKELASLHPSLQRRIIVEFFSIRNFSKVEQVRSLLKGKKEVNLGEGLKAVRLKGSICLKKSEF